MDLFRIRLQDTQPWVVEYLPEVRDEALRIMENTAKSQGLSQKARENVAKLFDRFVADLERNPLRVLNHPPVATGEQNVYRYAMDPQKAISAVADLDLSRRTLRVVKISFKGGGHGKR